MAAWTETRGWSNVGARPSQTWRLNVRGDPFVLSEAQDSAVDEVENVWGGVLPLDEPQPECAFVVWMSDERYVRLSAGPSIVWQHPIDIGETLLGVELQEYENEQGMALMLFVLTVERILYRIRLRHPLENSSVRPRAIRSMDPLDYQYRFLGSASLDARCLQMRVELSESAIICYDDGNLIYTNFELRQGRDLNLNPKSDARPWLFSVLYRDPSRLRPLCAELLAVSAPSSEASKEHALSISDDGQLHIWNLSQTKNVSKPIESFDLTDGLPISAARLVADRSVFQTSGYRFKFLVYLCSARGSCFKLILLTFDDYHLPSMTVQDTFVDPQYPLIDVMVTRSRVWAVFDAPDGYIIQTRPLQWRMDGAPLEWQRVKTLSEFDLDFDARVLPTEYLDASSYFHQQLFSDNRFPYDVISEALTRLEALRGMQPSASVSLETESLRERACAVIDHEIQELPDTIDPVEALITAWRMLIDECRVVQARHQIPRALCCWSFESEDPPMLIKAAGTTFVRVMHPSEAIEWTGAASVETKLLNGQANDSGAALDRVLKIGRSLVRDLALGYELHPYSSTLLDERQLMAFIEFTVEAMPDHAETRFKIETQLRPLVPLITAATESVFRWLDYSGNGAVGTAERPDPKSICDTLYGDRMLEVCQCIGGYPVSTVIETCRYISQARHDILKTLAVVWTCLISSNCLVSGANTWERVLAELFERLRLSSQAVLLCNAYIAPGAGGNELENPLVSSTFFLAARGSVDVIDRRHRFDRQSILLLLLSKISKHFVEGIQNAVVENDRHARLGYVAASLMDCLLPGNQDRVQMQLAMSHCLSSLGEHLLLRGYLALINQEEDYRFSYFAGLCCLKFGQYHQAMFNFSKTWTLLTQNVPLGVEAESFFSRIFAHPTDDIKYHFAVGLIDMFQEVGRLDLALQMADSALQMMPDPSHMRRNVLCTIFNISLELQWFDKAYNVIVSLDKGGEEIGLSCLRQLVSSLCDFQEKHGGSFGGLEKLCSYAWPAPLRSHVVKALYKRAFVSSTSVEQASFFNRILFAFLMDGGEHRTAARYMHSFVQYLERDYFSDELNQSSDSSQRETRRLELIVQCYVTVIQLLSLLPENAWLLISENMPQGNQDDQDSRKRARSIDPMDDSEFSMLETGGFFVVGIEDVRKMCLLRRTQLDIIRGRLLPRQVDACARASPDDTFAFVLKLGWVHRAFQLADAFFPYRLGEVFQMLIDNALRLDAYDSSVSLNLSHRPESFAAEKSLGLKQLDRLRMDAWSTLEQYVKQYDSAKSNYEFSKLIAVQILSQNESAHLPQWLIQHLSEGVPTWLIRCLLKYDLPIQAAQLYKEHFVPDNTTSKWCPESLVKEVAQELSRCTDPRTSSMLQQLGA